ncbi:Chromatin-remodeling ATPase INO80 [Plecturocebus cupreus]
MPGQKQAPCGEDKDGTAPQQTQFSFICKPEYSLVIVYELKESFSFIMVTAVPLDSYCNDRSAEYERRVLKEGGSLAAKQCLLNGAPELAADWLNRRSQFFPEPAGGLWSIRPQNGWSFIRIPGENQEDTPCGPFRYLEFTVLDVSISSFAFSNL